MMGKRYVQHSDLCGCERCAIQADREHPQPVFDAVDDPDILDCGCHASRGCECDFYDDYDDFDEYDPADECMLGPDGQCGAAGSEWCDFECPNRDSELFVGSAAWQRKHQKGGSHA